MDDILAQAKNYTDEAEVFTVSSEETPVHFEANRLKSIQTKQSTSTSLRIIRQGRIGYATTNETGADQKLVAMAVETARFGMSAKFEFPAVTSYPQVEVFDPAVTAVSMDEMVRLGEELIAAITRHTPGIVCEGGVGKSITSVRIQNSRGGEANYRSSTFGVGIGGALIRGTDMLFVGDSESSCHPITNIKKIIDEVLWQLELAQNQAAVASQPLPVIFTPHGVASALVAPLMAAFNGKTVLEGASPIGSKLGQTVFDAKLWLWDDATIPYRPASRPCDEEGVPSQRTPLVEQGVVSHFLYDLQTAALAHTRSTGNGQRSRGGLPTPAPSALIIGTGNVTFDEMVSDIKEGLVVDQLMGAEQGNILGGDFSGNVLLGYKVESGKIVGRVKNTMLSGNIYQLLKEIAAIGNESRWVDGFLQTPPIYLSRVWVASK